jgi:1,2-phenylacetyl-CoA epoxidase catalytic subunit
MRDTLVQPQFARSPQNEYTSPTRGEKEAGEMAIDDPHAMSPDDFRDQVHTFEFWFGAVRGYLEGREYGHRPETRDSERSREETDRLVSVLCNYCVGEAAALEATGGLIQIAPNRASKVFLATQAVDEGRHLEVLVHRLGELGVSDPEQEIERRADPSLRRFKQRLLELVNQRDWISSVFAQNVILESMEFAVFDRHAKRADPVTREVLLGIVKDERRHIGFGENEIGRMIQGDHGIRERLRPIRQELDALVLESFERTAAKLGIADLDRAELGRHYLRAVERLGFA